MPCRLNELWRIRKGGRLSCSIRDYAVIARAQQAFPTADSERQDALEFMVFRLVRPVHQSRQQAEAAGVVSGGAYARLHEGTRDGIHFSKTGIGESLLRGECIRGKRYAEGREAECVASIKKTVGVRLRLELDDCGRRRHKRVNRLQTFVREKGIGQRRVRRYRRNG